MTTWTWMLWRARDHWIILFDLLKLQSFQEDLPTLDDRKPKWQEESCWPWHVYLQHASLQRRHPHPDSRAIGKLVILTLHVSWTPWALEIAPCIVRHRTVFIASCTSWRLKARSGVCKAEIVESWVVGIVHNPAEGPLSLRKLYTIHWSPPDLELNHELVESWQMFHVCCTRMISLSPDPEVCSTACTASTASKVVFNTWSYHIFGTQEMETHGRTHSEEGLLSLRAQAAVEHLKSLTTWAKASHILTTCSPIPSAEVGRPSTAPSGSSAAWGSPSWLWASEGMNPEPKPAKTHTFI